jgi:hypothetical protein
MPTIQVPGALEDDALLVGLDLPVAGLEKVEAGISARIRSKVTV